MKKILDSLGVPVLLLILGVLAFGLQALWLGYYLDDWVFLYHIYRGGYERLAAYSFGVNRPFGAWPWWVGFNLLGYAPLGWQLWSLAWRILTALLLWLGCKRIFPEKKLEISLACALFLVYPIFAQQTAAVTFSDHWTCFALYALSVWLMVLSIQRPRFYVPLTGLALAASALELFTIEYFVGLELIRPLLLWFVYRDIPEKKARLKKALLGGLPYTALLGVFLTWRFAFMPTPGFDRNQPALLVNFFQAPIQTAAAFSVQVVQDLVEALVGAWYKTYNPKTIALSPISSLAAWGVAALVFWSVALFFFFLSRRAAQPAADQCESKEWLLASFAIMLAGFLPAWVTGQQLVSNGNYSDRFGLAAMFGVSLFVVSAAGFLLRQKHQILLVCGLIALASGYQFRAATEFRWGWERQSQLAWQFSWRMPGLQPGTAVYGDGALVNGSWVDIAWLNFLYGEPSQKSTDDYWYFDLNKLDANNLPAGGQPISETRFEHLSFEGSTTDSLVIQAKSVPNQCLWVVTGADLINPYLDPVVKEAVPLSNAERISAQPKTNPNMGAVFLAEPAHTWCYYFEKADLAAEQGRWDEVKTLWQALSAEGLKTGVAVEYLPFVYGVANAGDFETALAISARAKSIDVKMHDPLCQTWQTILAAPALAQNPPALKQEIIEQLACEYLIH